MAIDSIEGRYARGRGRLSGAPGSGASLTWLQLAIYRAVFQLKSILVRLPKSTVRLRPSLSVKYKTQFVSLIVAGRSVPFLKPSTTRIGPLRPPEI